MEDGEDEDVETRWTFGPHQCVSYAYMMIIRPLILRHGRLALPKSSTPNGTLRRSISRTAILCRPQAQATAQAPPTTPSEIRDPSSPVAQDWAFYHHQRTILSPIGSTLPTFYQPHTLISNPPRPQDITLELLLASQCHIGHATSLWHPANARHIFGIRGDKGANIHIISLDATASHLRRACKIVRGVTSRGGLVLFVGTREGQARIVTRAAGLAKGCHLFTRWIPGSITNGQQILGGCGKVVVDEHDAAVPGFADQLPDSSALKPDLVVCLNPTDNYVLLHECGLHNIPTIGIVDTDANPTWLTYPIPANDDSLRSVQVLCGALGRAGEEGQAIRRAKAKRDLVVSMPSHGLQPPREGQVQKEMEEQRAAAERKREDDQLWARIALEVPGGVVPRGESRPLELDDAALEGLDATGGNPSAPLLRDASIADPDVDAPLNEPPEYGDQPYERTRALTAAERAQAPLPSPLEDFGGELDASDDDAYWGGLRDERDPK